MKVAISAAYQAVWVDGVVPGCCPSCLLVVRFCLQVPATMCQHMYCLLPPFFADFRARVSRHIHYMKGVLMSSYFIIIAVFILSTSYVPDLIHHYGLPCLFLKKGEKA